MRRGELAHGGKASLEETSTYASPPGLEWDDENYRGSAYPVYGFAACVVEVEVDPVSFELKIVDIVTCQDVGRAIHPAIVEGQIEGGIAQAMGYGGYEVVAMVDGGMRNTSLSDYVIPTAVDLPPIRVLLHEESWSGGPFGAKGIGEMPMGGGAPALVSAISQAMGRSFRRIPVTAERLAEVGTPKQGGAAS